DSKLGPFERSTLYFHIDCHMESRIFWYYNRAANLKVIHEEKIPEMSVFLNFGSSKFVFLNFGSCKLVFSTLDVRCRVLSESMLHHQLVNWSSSTLDVRCRLVNWSSSILDLVNWSSSTLDLVNWSSSTLD
ncbi:hypothetical protein L9F63_024100, partial [Diploptera punctata]